jgi:hypothetical protein
MQETIPYLLTSQNAFLSQTEQGSVVVVVVDVVVEVVVVEVVVVV